MPYANSTIQINPVKFFKEKKRSEFNRDDPNEPNDLNHLNDPNDLSHLNHQSD
jgi:hypothetical protein